MHFSDGGDLGGGDQDGQLCNGGSTNGLFISPFGLSGTDEHEGDILGFEAEVDSFSRSSRLEEEQDYEGSAQVGIEECEQLLQEDPTFSPFSEWDAESLPSSVPRPGAAAKFQWQQGEQQQQRRQQWQQHDKQQQLRRPEAAVLCPPNGQVQLVAPTGMISSCKIFESASSSNVKCAPVTAASFTVGDRMIRSKKIRPANGSTDANANTNTKANVKIKSKSETMAEVGDPVAPQKEEGWNLLSRQFHVTCALNSLSTDLKTFGAVRQQNK
eukprot:SAG11_NODE_367_length_10114_cov_16.930904_7_plen_270_part_00